MAYRVSRTMKIIARVRTPFTEKFGIPRQSGLADLTAEIIFEPEYRVREAFRGLEGYSHLWLLWEFSEAVREDWSPTVRPPRLGGNVRMGVFATRSPFRPNPIGLSSVRLKRIDYDRPDSPVLIVSGADILDGTPIYDVKPYLAYTDSHPDAEGGFALQQREGTLQVDFPAELLEKVPEQLCKGLTEVLAQDPRPQYQHSPERVYMMNFADFDVHFSVDGGILTVRDVLFSPKASAAATAKNAIIITDGAPYLDQIKTLIAEYARSLDRDLSFQDFDKELADLSAKYLPPNGRIFAAVTENGVVIGCVAYRKHNYERCEMKRLYVRPEYRRCHAGGKLVEEVIRSARADGFSEMVLDTIKPLENAVRLYKKYGFEETEPYYANPMKDVIYMKLRL